MIQVLFVCLGNICRSPMAEAVLRHMAEREGLSGSVLADSAGTGDWHTGEPPHSGTRKRLAQAGISDRGIRARLLTHEDIKRFDFIIGMDARNLANIRKLCALEHTGKAFLLADFLPEKRWPTGRDVPDPWYTGDFDQTFRLVWEGCTYLLTEVKKRLEPA